MKSLDYALEFIFRRHRWIVHISFWLLILLWYVVFFGRQNGNYFQSLFFASLVLPVTIGTTYFVNYFLIPRFLLKERYVRFLVYFIYTLIISVFLEMMMTIATFYLQELKMKNMSQASWDSFFLLTSLLAVVFLAMTIKLLLHWRTTKEAYQKLMLEKVEKELKFLKAQLNPHFLFNTLNNLYYLTTQKSDLAPAAILQLSEILDYSLYTSKAQYVPLHKEWQQVQNYIALESLHYEDRLDIEARISGDIDKCSISPMMIISLVENAFKHGALKSKGNAWIKLNVDCSNEQIYISIRNSYQKTASDKVGIGMENLRNQLELLYSKTHQLSIDKGTPGEFSLTLILIAQP